MPPQKGPQPSLLLLTSFPGSCCPQCPPQPCLGASSCPRLESAVGARAHLAAGAMGLCTFSLPGSVPYSALSPTPFWVAPVPCAHTYTSQRACLHRRLSQGCAETHHSRCFLAPGCGPGQSECTTSPLREHAQCNQGKAEKKAQKGQLETNVADELVFS